MNQQHLDILKLGVNAWNNWREAHPEIIPDLSGAVLAGLKANGINFTRTDLRRTVLYGAELAKSMFIGANLYKTICIEACLDECFFSGTQLLNTSFNSASLRLTNFMRSTLMEVDLSHCDLRGADFRLARLEQVNLEFAILSGLNLANSRLHNCLVNGMIVANLETRGLQTKNLILTNHEEPTVTVDDLEVAQAVFSRIQDIGVDFNLAAEKKLVLVFGSFYNERRRILRTICRELERRKLLPVVVHFDKPVGRGFLELIRQLTWMTRYFIGDVSQLERASGDFLDQIALFKLPVQLLALASGDGQARLSSDLQNYPWVLSPYFYKTTEEATVVITEKLIGTLEMKNKEMQTQKKI